MGLKLILQSKHLARLVLGFVAVWNPWQSGQRNLKIFWLLRVSSLSRLITRSISMSLRSLFKKPSVYEPIIVPPYFLSLGLKTVWRHHISSSLRSYRKLGENWIFLKTAWILKNHRHHNRQPFLWDVLYFFSGICIGPKCLQSCAAGFCWSDFFNACRWAMISAVNVVIQRWTLAVVVKKVVAFFYKFLSSIISKIIVSWLTLLVESSSTFHPANSSLAPPGPESILWQCLRRVPLCGRCKTPYGRLTPTPHRWMRSAGLLSNL